MRVGGLVARYADSVDGAAVFAAPRLEHDRGSFRSALEASLAQFGQGSWAAQAGGEFAATRRINDRASLAAALSASGSRLEGGIWSGQALLGFAAGYAAGPIVISAGGAAGGVRPVGGGADITLALLGGASAELSGIRLRASSRRASVGPRRYTDLGVGAGRSLGPVTADLDLGARLFDGANDDLTWQARLATELTPVLTIEASAGAYPRSPDGFTEGRFATVGLRLTRPSFRSAVIERLGPGRVRVTLAVAGASQVAIAGEWNAWTPIAMSPAGGSRWTVELPLANGAHKFSLLVDGSRWTVPRGVPTLPDDFGGTVGLLVVG